MQTKDIPLVTILGATASGKTALSIAIAKAYNGEIISADAYQIYRNLNVGTAKPTVSEQEGIPHHLMDCLPLDASYSVAKFQTDSAKKIADIYQRGKLPILVGGTGLYIQALLEGYKFVEQDEVSQLRWRSRLLRKLKYYGRPLLLALLAKRLPEFYQKNTNADDRRIVRALEKYYGKVLANNAKELQLVYKSLVIGLEWPRSVLYARINKRVEQMFAQGLVDENNRLRQRHPTCEQWQSMQAIGYKQFSSLNENNLPIEQIAENIKQATRNLAKRQITWFKRMSYIRWLSAEQPQYVDCAKDCVGRFLTLAKSVKT